MYMLGGTIRVMWDEKNSVGVAYKPYSCSKSVVTYPNVALDNKCPKFKGMTLCYVTKTENSLTSRECSMPASASHEYLIYLSADDGTCQGKSQELKIQPNLSSMFFDSYI